MTKRELTWGLAAIIIVLLIGVSGYNQYAADKAYKEEQQRIEEQLKLAEVEAMRKQQEEEIAAWNAWAEANPDKAGGPFARVVYSLERLTETATKFFAGGE
ncbi:hypothetical protein FACS189493_0860 [Spirochaetia bacterium]|nr:hypothetical protein FACS189493_0860 [Spirochaetia bacterium]